jgi:hypothetical protein
VYPDGEIADGYPAGVDSADGESDVTGIGITETTGMVKVTVGDAELHAEQTATVVVKPAGTSEGDTAEELAPGEVTTVAVYGIVV